MRRITANLEFANWTSPQSRSPAASGELDIHIFLLVVRQKHQARPNRDLSG